MSTRSGQGSVRVSRDAAEAAGRAAAVRGAGGETGVGPDGAGRALEGDERQGRGEGSKVQDRHLGRQG